MFNIYKQHFFGFKFFLYTKFNIHNPKKLDVCFANMFHFMIGILVARFFQMLSECQSSNQKAVLDPLQHMKTHFWAICQHKNTPTSQNFNRKPNIFGADGRTPKTFRSAESKRNRFTFPVMFHWYFTSSKPCFSNYNWMVSFITCDRKVIIYCCVYREFKDFECNDDRKWIFTNFM